MKILVNSKQTDEHTKIRLEKGISQIPSMQIFIYDNVKNKSVGSILQMFVIFQQFVFSLDETIHTLLRTFMKQMLH